MEENWEDSTNPYSSYQQYDGDRRDKQYEQHNRRRDNNNYKRPDYSSNRNRQDNRGRNFQRTNSRSRQNRDASRSFDEENCKIFIETSKLGKLIGRGGSQIKELQDQSGAKINIQKDCVNGDSTLVLIQGSLSTQNKVKSMIDDLLIDRPYDDKSDQTNRSNRYQQRNKFDDRYENKSSYRDENKSEDRREIRDENGEIDWDRIAKEHDEYQKEKWAKYPAIQKNFYKEDPSVANMSKELVDQIRFENNEIDVQHTFEVDESLKDSPEYHIPNPIQTFEQAFKVQKQRFWFY